MGINNLLHWLGMVLRVQELRATKFSSCKREYCANQELRQVNRISYIGFQRKKNKTKLFCYLVRICLDSSQYQWCVKLLTSWLPRQPNYQINHFIQLLLNLTTHEEKKVGEWTYRQANSSQTKNCHSRTLWWFCDIKSSTKTYKMRKHNKIILINLNLQYRKEIITPCYYLFISH